MNILLTNYCLILVTISIFLRLFSRTKKLSFIAYGCALLIALHYNYVEPIGFAYLLVAITILVISCQNNIDPLIKVSTFIFVLVFGFSLLKHSLIGFNNTKIIYEQVKAESAIFNLWLNYDTILFCTIIFLLKYQNVSLVSFLRSIFIGILYFILSAGILGSLAYYNGLIKFDFSIPKIIWIWVWIAGLYALFEESFFRMYIIDYLTKFKPESRAMVIFAVTLSMVLFAYKHIFGGIYYVALSAIASILYSLSYLHSGKRIGASFTTHFLLNLFHIIFFTYPFLDKQ